MLREFVDKNGQQWRVWDVSPLLHLEDSARSSVAFSLVPTGWLCFESGDERRRLTPVPDGWEQCEECTLEDLRDRAERVVS